MGAGKSHFGRIIAAQQGKAFIDSDDVIEKNTGQSISDIFKTSGESVFRQIEHDSIKRIITKHPDSIIATGGGCITNPETLALLKEQTTMIWLQSPPEDIYKRIKHDQSRPLLQTENPLQTLTDLLRTREFLYAQAHIHCTIDANDTDKTLATITKALAAHLKDDT